MLHIMSTFGNKIRNARNGVSNSSEIIMQYGAFSALGMALGLSAISGAAWWVTLLISLWLLRGQVLLSRAASREGAAGALARIVYFLAALLSVILAFAALFHLLSAERFAEKAFEKALNKAVPEINRVTATYVGVAGLLETAEAHSDRMARLEEQVGGSCGRSAPAAGPIQRVRQADRLEMAQLSRQFRTLADELTVAKAEASAAVARYDGARKAVISRQVNSALDRARIAAVDPSFQSMRSRIGDRIQQDKTGLRDPLTGHAVVCRDPMLKASLLAVMAVDAPKPIRSVSLPENMSHRGAVFTVLGDLAGVFNGQPLDLELYLLPMLLSPLPELAFLIGLSQRRRELCPPARLVDSLAARVGLPPGASWDALNERLQCAANERALSKLETVHIVDRSWMDRVDYLRIPVDDDHSELHLLAHLLVDRGKATDLGIGRAGAAWADFTPSPQDPETLSRFVKLNRGVWRALVLETLTNRQGGRAAFTHAAE